MWRFRQLEPSPRLDFELTINILKIKIKINEVIINSRENEKMSSKDVEILVFSMVFTKLC